MKGKIKKMLESDRQGVAETSTAVKRGHLSEKEKMEAINQFHLDLAGDPDDVVLESVEPVVTESPYTEQPDVETVDESFRQGIDEAEHVVPDAEEEFSRIRGSDEIQLFVENPFLPEGGEQPEAADVTAVLEEPEMAGMPTTLEEPEMAGVPTTLEEPEMPGMPAALEELETAGMPTALEEPEMAGMPTVPEEPEMAGMPTALEEPGTADMPTVLEEPEMMGMPASMERPEMIIDSPAEGEPEQDTMNHRMINALCTSGFTMEAVNQMMKSYIDFYQVDYIAFASIMTAEIFARHALHDSEKIGEKRIDMENTQSLWILTEMIKEGEWICSDTAILPEEQRNYFEEIGIKSQIMMPIYVRQQLFGVAMAAQLEEQRAWDQEEIEMFRKMVKVTSDILKQKLLKIS